MICKIIYMIFSYMFRAINKAIIVPGIKSTMGKCGTNVRLSYDLDIRGNKNIYIGSNVQIGPHSILWTTRARLIINDNVLIGPNLTVITGDHRVDVIGKHIIDVKDSEKLPGQDADVIIGEGVWIGARVTILKGVTIGEGAVIAAGAIVTKDVEPYSICCGVPCKKIKNRFTSNQLEKHKRLLQVKENEEKGMHDSTR